MRRDEIDADLKEAAFEFFYCFSRFEFALKENGFLKTYDLGKNADASWADFSRKYAKDFQHSDQTKRIIELHPKRQIVSRHGLDWKPVGLSHCDSDLCQVITMLSTVRNNLFHGGKHGDVDVDSKSRNLELLNLGQVVIGQLAEFSDLQADYSRIY